MEGEFVSYRCCVSFPSDREGPPPAPRGPVGAADPSLPSPLLCYTHLAGRGGDMNPTPRLAGLGSKVSSFGRGREMRFQEGFYSPLLTQYSASASVDLSPQVITLDLLSPLLPPHTPAACCPQTGSTAAIQTTKHQQNRSRKQKHSAHYGNHRKSVKGRSVSFHFCSPHLRTR